MIETAQADHNVVQNLINKVIDDLDPELRQINRKVSTYPYFHPLSV